MVRVNRGLHLFFFARILIVLLCAGLVFFHCNHGDAPLQSSSAVVVGPVPAAVSSAAEEALNIKELAQETKATAPSASDHVSITGIQVIKSDITGVRNYEKSFPPLLEAVYKGILVDVKKELEGGADPNMRSFDGSTAISYACRNGDDTDNVKIFDLLIEYGARARIADVAGYTPIHIIPVVQDMSKRNYYWEVLVKHGAQSNSVTRMVESNTKLVGERMRGYNVLEILIDNFDRLGVIDALVQWGWLMNKGMQTRARAHAYDDAGLRDYADEFDKYWQLVSGFKGVCPLMDLPLRRKLNVFVEYEGLRVFEYTGAYDPIIFEGKTIAAYRGFTPLMQALLKGSSVAIDDILKKERFQLNARSGDRYARTALHLAVIHQRVDYVKQLLGAGALVGVRDWQGNTPLHTVAWIDDILTQKKLTPLLLAAGAKFDSVNNKGDTVLHHAVRCNESAYVAYLLHDYKDINRHIKNKQGLTPKALAESYRRFDLVKLFTR
jgi:ankyrin repeat protein